LLFIEYAAFLASDFSRPFAASDLSSQNLDQELAHLPGGYASADGVCYWSWAAK
jgi:hypothetical protein